MVSKLKEIDVIAINNKTGSSTKIKAGVKTRRKAMQRDIDKANKRYRSLLKNPEMQGVPALQKARKIIGDSGKFSISGLSESDATAYMAQVQRFLDDVSSTVTGYRKALKHDLYLQGYTKAEIKKIGNNINNLTREISRVNIEIADIVTDIYGRLDGDIYHLPDFYSSVVERLNEYRDGLKVNTSELYRYHDDIVRNIVNELSYDNYIENETDEDDIDILYEKWGNDTLLLN